MVLDLNTIIEIISNTLKRVYLLDDITIEEVTKTNGKIDIYLTSKEDEKMKKYEVSLFVKVIDTNWLKIYAVSLNVFYKCDGHFPVIVGSYTARGLVDFETSMRNTLCEVMFHNDELGAVIK